MKSLIKIYVKYMASALLLMAGFVILQLVVAGIVIGGIYGRTLTSGHYSIQTAYQLLKEDPGEAEEYVSRMGAAFAMLLDNQSGEIVWSSSLPKELAHPYTLSQVASFSRWYLEDYPVSVWGGETGLLVVGYPRGSIWNYYVHQDMDGLTATFWFLGLSAAATVLAVILILLISGFRYYRRMRTLTDAVERLALGGSVHMAESGTLKEIARTINQTSDRLTAQREKLAQRDQARTEWISGVSHDIRTPLSLILGYAEMLERQEGGDVKTGAAMIRRQGLKIRRLIEDLNLASRLEYSMQPVRPARLSPAAVLRKAAAEFLNSLEHPERYPFSISIDPAAEGAALMADEQLLLRAIQNLLGNSVRHNETGCRIFVEARLENSWFAADVSDDGKGIPQQICRYLDQGILPPETVHIMGLKIVKQIVEASGGMVRTSKEGHQVELRFPLLLE